MSRVLVAGVNGFVGHHVAQQLFERGHAVLGVGNQPEAVSDVRAYVEEYVGCDLTDADAVRNIPLSQVDAIINLAGLAKVGESRGQGELYTRVNVGVHTTLYEECVRQSVAPRIIAVSTGAVYRPNQPMPLNERSSLMPNEKANEYVVSKKRAEEAIVALGSRGLRCVIVRPFNHTGPGQLPGYLLPDLAEQIDNAVTNNTALRVGNLDTKRDFTDVRDVARAYIELALCDETKLLYDIYNICSGKSIAGREILRLLTEAVGVHNLGVEIDPDKIRPNEIMDIYGSYSRLYEAIGWEPSIPVETTVADFIAWRSN